MCMYACVCVCVCVCVYLYTFLCIEKLKNHEELFVKDIQRVVVLVSCNHGIRHKGLDKKFIVEHPTPLEGAMNIAEMYIQLEDFMRRTRNSKEVSIRGKKKLSIKHN